MKKKIKIMKKNRILIVLTVVIMISMTVFWKIRLSSAYVSKEQIIEGNTSLQEREFDYLFSAKTGSIQKVSFCNDDTGADYSGRTVDIRVAVSDSERENTIWEQNFQNIKLQTNSFGDTVNVQKTVELKKGQQYVLHVFINEKETDKISVALYGERGSILGLYIVCCGLILIIVLISLVMFDAEDKEKFKIGFVLVMLLQGILANIALMPLCVPDEDYHFMRAYHISNQMMGIQEDGYNMAVTESGISRMLEFGNMQNTYYYWTDWNYGNQKVDYFSTRYVKYVTQSGITDIAYIPGALAITLCRYLNAPYQVILLAGRMMNLILLIMFALVAMNVYSELTSAIVAICLLPSTVWLAASFSYDTWNLAFSMLFVTYCCYCGKKTDQMRLRDVLVLFILLALFAPIKIIYIIMALSVLTISNDKWKNRKLLIATGMAILCAGALILVVKGPDIAAILTSNMMDTRGIGDAAANSYTIGWVIRHPVMTLLIIIHTLIIYTEKYLTKGLTGEFMGTNVPSFLTALLAGLILLIMMGTADVRRIEKRERRLTWFIYIVGVFSVFMTFLFTYNNISENQIGVIEGVQGRYFIPFMIYLPWMLSSQKIGKYVNATEERTGKKVLLIGIVMAGVWVFFCKFSGITKSV